MAKEKTRKIKPKKISDLLAECDLAEADLVGEIRKRNKKSPAAMRAIMQPGKQGGSFIRLEMNANQEVSLQVNKMGLKDSVGVLMLAAINLVRTELTKNGQSDIHPALDLFMELATSEANTVHTAWHKDNKK